MESVSILHCADLHLGSSFSGLPPNISAERSNDLRRMFLKIIDICKAEKINLLLIAGDLFDGIHVPESLTDMVRGAFASIPGTYVAIAPGNHDPAVFDSPYRNKDIWPKNVQIFTGGLSCLSLPMINVRLWGAAFTNVYQDKPMLTDLQPTDGGLINVCVMHGDIVPAGGVSQYNPITPEMIAKSGMDYLALGHVHKRSDIARAGGVYYAYPGSPEGLGFDEKGGRGVYMGEVSRGVCDMNFYTLNRRTYVDINIDATGLQRHQIVKLIQDMIRTDKTKSADNLIRVVMTGMVTEDSMLSPEYAAAALADVFYLSLTDQTVLSVQPDKIRGDFTLRNIFVKKMQERIDQNPNDESLKLAMKLGLRSFYEKV